MAVWVAVISCCLASLTDVRHGRIPNWLTIPAALLAIAARLLDQSAGAGWLMGNGFAELIGLSLLSLFVILLFGSEEQQFGSGDAKLALVIGICLGPWRLLAVLFIASLAAAGALAAKRLLRKTSTIALAPFLTAAVVVTLLWELPSGGMR